VIVFKKEGGVLFEKETTDDPNEFYTDSAADITNTAFG
jgi:hypothetical protein